MLWVKDQINELKSLNGKFVFFLKKKNDFSEQIKNYTKIKSLSKNKQFIEPALIKYQNHPFRNNQQAPETYFIVRKKAM